MCACGTCGLRVTKPGNRFIHGHNISKGKRWEPWSDGRKKRKSEEVKTYFQTEEGEVRAKEQSERMEGNIPYNKDKTWEEMYDIGDAKRRREETAMRLHTKEVIEKAKITRNETYKRNGGLNHKSDCQCGVCKAKRGEYVGEDNPFYGKTPYFSKEWRTKHSEDMKRIWQDPVQRLSRLEKMAKGLKNRPTSYEQRIIELIEKFDLPFKYVGDGSFWVTSNKKNLNPDFIDIVTKKVIEVYEKYFKEATFGSVDNYKKERTYLFGMKGYDVIYIDGDDLRKENWEQSCLNLINERI